MVYLHHFDVFVKNMIDFRLFFLVLCMPILGVLITFFKVMLFYVELPFLISQDQLTIIT